MKADWKHILLHLAMFCLGFVCLAQQAYGSQMLKVWSQIYERVNPGQAPTWHGQAEAVNWVRSEKQRVEPIVLQIVRGEDPTVLWTAGVAVARAIPTPVIRDALFERMESIVAAGNGNIEPNSFDEMGVINILDILADERDDRLPALLVRLGLEGQQSQLVIERCLSAFQKIGTEKDLETVRAIASRYPSNYIARLSQMTGRVLEAKGSGEDLFANAEPELRALNQRFIRSIRTRNAREYLAVHRLEHQRAVREDEVAKEIFNNPEVTKFVEALERVADHEEFSFDRDKLQATLVVEGRFQVGYSYQLEGWRIGGVEQIAP